MFSIVFSPIEKKITVFSNELFIVNCFRLPADLQLYPIPYTLNALIEATGLQKIQIEIHKE